MAVSRSSARSVSTSIQLVSTGIIWIVARVTMPVRPIPPAVAQNRSGSDPGDTTRVPERGDQGQLDDVGTEAAVDVVVLAVDVGGDGAPDRDQPGARAHRHEPSEGDQPLHQ